MKSSPQMSHRSVPISTKAGACTLLRHFLIATAFIHRYCIYCLQFAFPLRTSGSGQQLTCVATVMFPSRNRSFTGCPRFCLHPRVALSDLNGGMAQQELKLLDLAAGQKGARVCRTRRN